MSPGTHRALEAIAVFVIVLIILAGTAGRIGLGYDEPVYMSRAQEAGQWLRLLVVAPGVAISDAALREYWDARNEQQPGFLKLWGALTTPLVAGVLPVLAALRFGTTLLVALLCASIYLFVAHLWGRLEAVAAVGALLTLPRTFTHAHLFALDAPVMALTFLALHGFFLCARERSWWWAAAGAAAWGLALSTKINALFVPIIVIPWLALCARDALVPVLVCGATVGPLCFLGSWPWLWHDTLARLGAYLRFHARHWQIAVTYFGRQMAPAPWHYPLVMTVITTPPVTLVAVMMGGVRVIHERAVATGAPTWRERWQDPAWRRRAAGALLGWTLLVNFALNSLPGTPKYNGVRLFQPVFPPLAILAGVGIGWAARVFVAWLRLLSARAGGGGGLEARPTMESQGLAEVRPVVKTRGFVAEARAAVNTRPARIVALMVVALVLAGPLRATVETYPHGLSYYSEAIGGLPGAVRLGMEPTYWGDTYLSAAAWLNEHAPPGSLVWIDPVGVESMMVMYRNLGMLRADIRTSAGPAIPAEVDFAVFQNKPTEFSAVARRLLATHRPVATIDLQGVPLLFIFDLTQEGELS